MQCTYNFYRLHHSSQMFRRKLWQNIHHIYILGKVTRGKGRVKPASALLGPELLDHISTWFLFLFFFHVQCFFFLFLLLLYIFLPFFFVFNIFYIFQWFCYFFIHFVILWFLLFFYFILFLVFLFYRFFVFSVFWNNLILLWLSLILALK